MESDDAYTGASISLRGKAAKEPFLDITDCIIAIANYTDNYDYDWRAEDTGEIIFGYLEKHEELSDDDPEFISATIPVTNKTFEDIRRCLLECSPASGNLFQVSLGVTGLQLGEIFIEDDNWPDSVKLKIVEFKYDFFHKSK